MPKGFFWVDDIDVICFCPHTHSLRRGFFLFVKKSLGLFLFIPLEQSLFVEKIHCSPLAIRVLMNLKKFLFSARILKPPSGISSRKKRFEGEKFLWTFRW